MSLWRSHSICESSHETPTQSTPGTDEYRNKVIMVNPKLAELGGCAHADYSRFSRCISCKINYPKEQVFCLKCKGRLRHAVRGLKWKIEHKRIE